MFLSIHCHKKIFGFFFKFYFLACIHNVTSMTFAQCSCGTSRNAVCDPCKTFFVRVLAKTFQAVFKSDFIGETIRVLIMRVIIELLIHFKMAFKITAWISFQGGYWGARVASRRALPLYEIFLVYLSSPFLYLQ